MKNLRTKTIGGFRAVHYPDFDRRRPWIVQRFSRGAWRLVMTYSDGPARFYEREHAINCAWNMEHFYAICTQRVKARPTRAPRRRG